MNAKFWIALCIIFTLMIVGVLTYRWTLSETLASNLPILDRIGSLGSDILNFFSRSPHDWIVIEDSGYYYYFLVDLSDPVSPLHNIEVFSTNSNPPVSYLRYDSNWQRVTIGNQVYTSGQFVIYQDLTRTEFNRIVERGFGS